MNSSSVSPGASGRTSPFHSSSISTLWPSSKVKVAATPVSSIFSATSVRSTHRPAGDSNTAPTPVTSVTACGTRP